MTPTFQDDPAHLVQTGRLLASRLERLSVDSYWAHRASGLRGSLLRWYERFEKPGQEAIPSSEDLAHLALLVERGFDVLQKAAREIKVPERF